MKSEIRENIYDMPIPPGYDAVGAYVWDVTLTPGEHLYVLTNDPVPDGDFKMIVDHHRKRIAKKTGTPVDSVAVIETKLVGFAQGAAKHERSFPPILDMEDGRVLISPEFANDLRSISDRIAKSDADAAERRKNAAAQSHDLHSVIERGSPLNAIDIDRVKEISELSEKRLPMKRRASPGIRLASVKTDGVDTTEAR